MTLKITDTHSARPSWTTAETGPSSAATPAGRATRADEGAFDAPKAALVPGIGPSAAGFEPNPRQAAIWRALDDTGVVYPPFADETGKQGNVRTNYAVVCKKANAVVIALDDGNVGAKGYVGFSEDEKTFATDVAEYAKSKGMTVIAFAHAPPNHKGRHGTQDHVAPDEFGAGDPTLAPDASNVEKTRAWITALRESDYSKVLFVFGHVHPKPSRFDPKDEDVDLDGTKDGKADVDDVILAGEVNRIYGKITLYEHGRSIEDLKVDDSAQTETVGRVFMDETGTVVPDASKLGKPTGIFYGTSDVQRDWWLKPYFTAMQRDAQGESSRGLPVHYLVAGDVMLGAKHIPVHLPQHENMFWVPGNHCYQNHHDLNEVVAFLQPEDGPVKMVVEYEKK